MVYFLFKITDSVKDYTDVCGKMSTAVLLKRSAEFNTLPIFGIIFLPLA
jgi:hypothetical protein